MLHFEYNTNYQPVTENNCFILFHDKNKHLNDYVESVDIDLDKKQIIIVYTKPYIESENDNNLKLEIYDKFGILKKYHIISEIKINVILDDCKVIYDYNNFE